MRAAGGARSISSRGGEPPPGEEIQGPDIGLHEPMTIEEAAQRASFPVFYVPELPEGRRDLHVMYAQARQRPPVKESVRLAFTAWTRLTT